MTNFEFADKLTIDPFSSYNEYYYGSVATSKMKFCSDSENLPYIARAGWVGSAKVFNLNYSWSNPQFKARLLNTKKIKDILDSSRYPIIVPVKDVKYFIGKGFLALPTRPGNDPHLLFVACVNGKQVSPKLVDVKFFVSRQIYNDVHKGIQPIIKELIARHVGDVIITSDMSKYLGETIKLPAGGTIQEQKKYKEAILKECLTDVLKEG